MVIFLDLNLHFSIRFFDVSKFLKFKKLELAFPLLKLKPIGFALSDVVMVDPSIGFFESDILSFVRLISSLNVSKSITQTSGDDDSNTDTAIVLYQTTTTTSNS